MNRKKKVPEGVYVKLHTGDPRIDEAMSGPVMTNREPIVFDAVPSPERWLAYTLWDTAAKRKWWQFWKRRKPIASGFFDEDGNVA